ncbi:protein of unknown function [Catalinimonas alkaloidigena]|uniref:DUF4249 domain-containing protein n=1 Tax=Catalinimonas alkaloidigena TaxID=1075417 RepID=A0A1G9GX20_9BACT|nr:DUF4249 domain-containing protein [Catalinimonas alkaloidigena]SDL05216.1 protein of unknown function [Catalinimonas alkaloidigena]
MLKKYCLTAILLLASCISPVSIEFTGQLEHLVVEAEFSNLPNRHYVRLTRSQPFNTGYNVFVDGARVFITSVEGEYYEFQQPTQKSAGYYYAAEGITAIPGHTYTLHVTTKTQTYQSAPVTVSQTVLLDSIRYEYAEKPFVMEGTSEQVVMPGYMFSVDYQDPAEGKNYYKWSYKLLFEVDTQPELYEDTEGGPQCPCRAPKPCCSQCWWPEQGYLPKVLSDRLTNGQFVINEQVFFLPFEKYMGVKLRLTLQQHNISEAAYEFFRALEEQKQSTGSVVDPPPSEIKGNIYNVANPDEQVIGFFVASAAAEATTYIVRNDIPYEVEAFQYWDDCREKENSIHYAPAGW